MSKVVVLAAVAAGLATGAAAASGGLPGTYVTTVTGATPSALNGTWKVAVTRTRYRITRNGRPAVAGTAALSSKRVTFHDRAGLYRCPPAQAVGTYAWSLRGKSLTLRVVKDACSGRKAILTNGFTKTS